MAKEAKRENTGSLGTGVMNSVSHRVAMGIEPRYSERAISGLSH